MEVKSKTIGMTELEVVEFIYSSDGYAIEDEFDALGHKLSEVDEKLKKLDNAKNVFVEFNVSYDDESFNKSYNELMKLRKEVSSKYNRFINHLSKKQDKCEHNFRNIGHDSHYDYYKCDKCNKEYRE